MNIINKNFVFELRQIFSNKIFNIQLYKNSFFLIMTKALVVATGFIFWIIAARFYSISNVGLAVGLISSTAVITQFSTFGLDFSIIRFISTYDKDKVFNTCIIITTISATILAIIYVLFVNILSPSLAFIQTPVYALIFIGFVIISSIVLITGTTFIALRKSEYSLIQNLIMAARLPLLLPFAFLGALGILAASGLAYMAMCIFVFYLLSKLVKFSLHMDFDFIKKSFKFFSGNYLANILYNAFYSLLPILVLNLLGEAESAKFYIAFTIATFFYMVPYTVGTSLFVEGSHGENLKVNVKRALMVIYAILVPGVIAIYFLGGYLLSFFGHDYVGSLDLLRLISISSFFFAAYALFIPIQNVRMKVGGIVMMNFVTLVLLLSSSYLFMIRFGTVGVGYAFILTFAIMSAVIACIARKLGWI